MSGTEENLNEMLMMRREKLKELSGKGKNPFFIEKYNYTHHSINIKENFEELEEQTVSVAGRIMSRRGHGKVSFMDLQDSKGRIQLFVKADAIGEETYKDLGLLDLGDIIAFILINSCILPLLSCKSIKLTSP